jgi:hypothetical protein
MFGIGKKKDDKVKEPGFIDKMKGKAMEKMMEKQMANLPEDQKQAMMSMIEKNPDFFKNISEEIETEVKSGKSQLVASMKVMRKHQTKMQQLMMESMGGNPRMSNRNLQ